MEDRGPGLRPGGAGGGSSGRWGEDERERRWGGGRDDHGPPGRREGGWGGPGDRGDREWGRGPPHRGGGDMRVGGGDHYRGDWGGGEPAWMHDESGSSAPPPPRPGRGPMTAKDLEAERQQFQAAWKAKQSEQVRKHGRMGTLHGLPPHNMMPLPQFHFRLCSGQGMQQQNLWAHFAVLPVYQLCIHIY